jgi:hypothetical protein
MPIFCVPPTSIFLPSFICRGAVVSETHEFNHDDFHYLTRAIHIYTILSCCVILILFCIYKLFCSVFRSSIVLCCGMQMHYLFNSKLWHDNTFLSLYQVHVSVFPFLSYEHVYPYYFRCLYEGLFTNYEEVHCCTKFHVHQLLVGICTLH